MSPHQAIAVAVRLFAIWLAACTLRAASAVVLAEHVEGRSVFVVGATYAGASKAAWAVAWSANGCVIA